MFKKNQKANKKVENKKTENKSKHNTTQDSFNICLNKMKDMKNVKGFIILVDNTLDNKNGSAGLISTCGTAATFVNLIQNIDVNVLEAIAKATAFDCIAKNLGDIEELMKKLR